MAGGETDTGRTEPISKAIRSTRARGQEQRHIIGSLHTALEMRKQYYFRESARGLLAWDVDRLIRLSETLPRERIPLETIREIDEKWFGDDESQTWRAMVDHIRLIDAADLSFPIILSESGAVMDGMHRVAKALLEGRREIESVRFAQDPEPDYVGRGPDDLPY